MEGDEGEEDEENGEEDDDEESSEKDEEGRIRRWNSEGKGGGARR